MRNAMRILSGLKAVAVLLLSAAMLSAEPAATGKVVGKVTKDGEPVASVKVVLAKPPAKDAAPGPDGKRAKPVVIAETQSDAGGAFTFADVAVGDYMVIAGDKDAGMGRSKVSVKADETTTVEVTIKVKPPEGAEKPKKRNDGN
jgi:hypothetical protein